MSQRVRFIGSSVTRLPLSGSDWIEVKTRLSGVEARRVHTSAFSKVTPPDIAAGKSVEVAVDFTALGMARTMAYLTGWNFIDAEGRQIKFSIDAVAALDEDTLKEIDEAIDKHVEAMDAESKAKSGEPASPQA